MFGIPDEVEERHAPGHEQKLIEEACEEYIRDPDSNCFPLNLREEVGDGTLLLAARTIYQLRTAREKQRLRLDSWQESLESAEQERRRFRLQTGALGVERDEARQERDKFRNEWHTVGRQLRSALRERNRLRRTLTSKLSELQEQHQDLRERLEDKEQEAARLRENNDALTSKLSELQQEHQDLQERLKDTEQEPARLRDENDSLASKLSELQQAHHYSQERLENTEQESARLREKNDALISQLSELQQDHHAVQQRLVDLEQVQVRLRNQNEVLARKLTEAPERYLASEDRLASIERELKEKNRIIKQLERKVGGYVKEIARLERKLDIAVARPKGELRRRNFIFVILAIAVFALFIVIDNLIENPDIMDQGSELLFTFLTDEAAPATAPVSSHTITVTPRPTITPSTTHTPFPTITPSASHTPPPTVTPRPTSTAVPTHTPLPTGTPLPAPAPQQFVVVEALGANARACPRMDCDVLTKLARDSRVAVMDEVLGETYRDSALWYRVALPDAPDDAYVHGSLLGTPDG